MKITEGDLEFDFSAQCKPLKFDEKDKTKANYHNLANMPRVDFIVEINDLICFLEIKDPANPKATKEDRKEFYNTLKDGKLIDSLCKKYWSSFVFRWAENMLNKDKIAYICLITLDDIALLVNLTDQLKKELYLQNKSQRWVKDPLAICIVLNLKKWNVLIKNCQVTRISENK